MSCGLKKLISLSLLQEGSSDCGRLFQSLKKAEVVWGIKVPKEEKNRIIIDVD